MGLLNRMISPVSRPLVGALAFILLLHCIWTARGDSDDIVTNSTQAASLIGERLFLETRFSKYFFAQPGGDANYHLATNDPVMNVLETPSGPVPGPFAAPAMGAMNCRQCHLVDELGGSLGNRTYADFGARSPIPDIGDGRTHTPRNSPTLVESLATSQTPAFFEPGFILAPLQISTRSCRANCRFSCIAMANSLPPTT